MNIIYIDGPSEEFELSTLGYLKKGIDMRLNEVSQQFESITRELEDRVLKASSDLAELNIEIQKQLEEHRTDCQSVDENVITHGLHQTKAILLPFFINFDS